MKSRFHTVVAGVALAVATGSASAELFELAMTGVVDQISNPNRQVFLPDFLGVEIGDSFTNTILIESVLNPDTLLFESNMIQLSIEVEDAVFTTPMFIGDGEPVFVDNGGGVSRVSGTAASLTNDAPILSDFELRSFNSSDLANSLLQRGIIDPSLIDSAVSNTLVLEQSAWGGEIDLVTVRVVPSPMGLGVIWFGAAVLYRQRSRI